MQNTVVIVNEVEDVVKDGAVALEKLTIDGCEPAGDGANGDTGRCPQEAELPKLIQSHVASTAESSKHFQNDVASTAEGSKHFQNNASSAESSKHFQNNASSAEGSKHFQNNAASAEGSKHFQSNVASLAEGSSNISTSDRPLLRSVSLASELTGISSEGTWKKTIQVGPDYQAVVPIGPCYSEVDSRGDDRLLWDPKKIEEHEVDSYLREVHGQHCMKEQGVCAIPVGNHIRDDEQALFLLVQCGYDVKEALRRRSMQQVCPVSTMSLWSEDECRSFETGLKTYGKNFHLIQRFKLRSRSVGDLVHFYYLWKKTERHDIFVSKNKIGKKKCTQLGTVRLHGEKLFPLTVTGAGKRCHDGAIFKSMILDVDSEFLVS